MSNQKLDSDERYHLQYVRDVHRRNQNNECWWCYADMTDPGSECDTMVTVDHLKPRAEGGGSSFLNTVASCRKCNSERSQKYFHRGRDVPIMRAPSK